MLSFLIKIASFLMLITLACPQITWGQEKIVCVRGRILDKSKEPIPGITILIEKKGTGTVSDVEGKFELAGLLAGEHTFIFSGVGFQQQVRKIAVLPGKSLNLDIELNEDIQEMEEVVVTGKSGMELVREKGFAANAIDMSEVQVHSIQANDLLDQSAGVRIRQDGGLGSRVRYNINGLTGNSIRIFLDGIPIENYGYSFSLSSIPTSIIERIEVYKGVVPAELASDALGGAINVVTKRNMPNTLNTSYSFGSFNTHQWSLNGNYRNNTNGFTFKGSAFYNYSDNNYKVWGDKVYVLENGKKKHIEAERFHDTYSSLGTKLDFGFTNVKWADQFFVGTVLSEMDKDIQNGATMEVVYGNRRMEQLTRLLHTTYTKHNFLTKGLDVNLFGSYSKLNRTITDTIPYMYNWLGERTYDSRTKDWFKWSSGAEGSNPTLNQDNETKYTGRLNLSYHLNRNTRLAFNYLLQDFARKPDDPLRPESERQLIDTRYLKTGVAGLTLENEAFDSRLRTSLFYKHYYQALGLKDARRERNVVTPYEYNSKTSESGYGLAFSFAITPKIRLLSSAENTLRLPESQEVFGNVTENIEPSYELKPERSLNLNLGFDLGPFEFERHSLQLNSNAFSRDIQGMIRAGVPDQLSETFPYENLDEVVSTGFDTEVKYSFDRKLNWSVGMSVFNARFNTQYDARGAEYQYYRDRLRNEPYFTMNSNIRYNQKDLIQKKSRTSFYYNLGYVHEFYRNWESIGGAGKDVIPTQIVHDLGVAYTFPQEKVTLSVDARNILNAQVFDNWALQKPGRAFYAKINYNIY